MVHVMNEPKGHWPLRLFVVCKMPLANQPPTAKNEAFGGRAVATYAHVPKLIYRHTAIDILGYAFSVAALWFQGFISMTRCDQPG